MRYKEIQEEIQDISRALKESTSNLSQNLKENPNVAGNLIKIQRDRSELNDLLSHTVRELIDHGSFQKLARKVDEETQMQSRLDTLKMQESTLKEEVEDLSKELEEERVAYRETVERQQTSASSLKQDLQGFKSSSGQETKHKERETHASLSCTRRLYKQDERKLEQRISEISQKMNTEKTVHDRTMDFLSNKVEDLQDQLRNWGERYQKEHAGLELQHDSVRSERNRLLEKLEALRQRKDAEDAAERRRREEEEARWREEMMAKSEEMRKNRAAQTLQSGFKTYLVRKEVYESKKPAKKGKKGGKKKK